MTTKSTRAILTAAFLAASAMAAIMASSAEAATLNSSVGSHLQAAETAMTKKDFPAAQAALAAAKAVGGRAPYDDYMIARIEVAIDAQSGDMAGATTAAMAAADSPALPQGDKPADVSERQDVLKNALLLSLNAKQYAKSITYAKQLDANNPTDPLVIQAIGNAYYYGGDFADAKTSAQKRIDASVKAGKVPDRNSLQILLNAEVGMKDEAGAEDTLEKEVAYYNDPADWAQMIDVAFSTKGLRDVDAIWLGRLLFLSGATVSTADATMIGATASHLTYFGDAQNAQQRGGTVDPDPGPRAEADKKTIQSQITTGQGPKGTGTYNAKLAEALYSYGMYPEAEAAAQLAITKGGDPDTSEAPMVLGQAQAAQGKYDAALATFGQVTGGGPATPRIVRLWVDYVNLKKNPPAAAPAQAAAH